MNKALAKVSKPDILIDNNIKSFISKNAYAINEQRIVA